ncbi:MAG: ABC transporter ATP-binding protein [Deltaproteobacteria bacterium]|nr:ABC transporter ATP-binding protein [Deltaproteobacteria bacterium]
MAALIEVRGLAKSFSGGGKQVDVLADLDLSLSQGERLAIVGESGVGKSTLLYIIGTLERPDRGTLHYEGRDVTAWSDDEVSGLRNRTIGFVFQFHHLLPDFSALENVMMPALIARWDRPRARASALELLETVGLGHRLTHRPGELSGGEQQRVAIARSLILGPRVMLADEPTGNLDPATAGEIEDLLCGLNEKRGLGLIVTTHNRHLAARMNRQLELRGGLLHPFTP